MYIYLYLERIKGGHIYGDGERDTRRESYDYCC